MPKPRWQEWGEFKGEATLESDGVQRPYWGIGAEVEPGGRVSCASEETRRRRSPSTWKKLPSQELLGSRAALEVDQSTGREDAVRALGELYKALTAFDASPLRAKGWSKGFLGTVSPSGVRHLLCCKKTSGQMSRTETLWKNTCIVCVRVQGWASAQ